MREAILVVDMLNDFVLSGAPLEVPHNREILPALADRVEQARQQGTPVVYVCDAHAEDDSEFEKMGWPPHAVAGTRGAEIVSELAPQEGDRIVRKKTYSAFYQTELEEVLKEIGAEALIITGCVSNICIMSAVADAALRGYRVTVPVDSVASINKDDGEFAFRQMASVYGAVVER
ncbi:MAG: nicotinamidase [Desulfuromonas sp.]|nr:MAG: nicotinamidase [Desulfuromonas sp.]